MVARRSPRQRSVQELVRVAAQAPIAACVGRAAASAVHAAARGLQRGPEHGRLLQAGDKPGSARNVADANFGTDNATNTEFQPPAAVGQYHLEQVIERHTALLMTACATLFMLTAQVDGTQRRCSSHPARHSVAPVRNGSRSTVGNLSMPPSAQTPGLSISSR